MHYSLSIILLNNRRNEFMLTELTIFDKLKKIILKFTFYGRISEGLKILSIFTLSIYKYVAFYTFLYEQKMLPKIFYLFIYLLLLCFFNFHNLGFYIYIFCRNIVNNNKHFI